MRLSGCLVPLVTGDNVFYTASDDQDALFLSTDDHSDNKAQIAWEPAWNGSRDWVGTANRPNRENTPAPIHLQAGTAYCIEALMKETSGGDNLAVTWRMPGVPEPTNGAAPIPGQFLAPPRHPSAVAVAIDSQPVDQTVGELAAVTFQVGATGTSVITYQWLKKGVAIPQAIGPSYTIPSVPFADSGGTFTVEVLDADLPAQTFAYALRSGAAATASIDVSGRFQ